MICMALSSSPRYAVFVILLNCMFLCHYIFDNCRLAITSGFRWMDERMTRDGWRRMHGEGWMEKDGWMNRGMDS